MAKVVTANELRTGAVVYLRGSDWVVAIADADTFADGDAADNGLSFAKHDAERAIIVDPFLTEVGPVRDGRATMTLRDSIRAYGPTIRFLPTASAGGLDENVPLR